MYPFVSDYVTYYLQFINEKPMSSILVPVTLSLFCYYIYIFVRKFYPICVNCWFCNANFKVAFEDRFEFTCIECGQFNGFKEDGSYSKIIPEQHDHQYNKTIFTINQNDNKESKNGLCHKCNIIQEMKVKQLASFIPTKEKYFDREIEKFKENLEMTLKLCSKCNKYMRKILSLQEKRYNLNTIRMNNRRNVQNVSSWPNICSLCLSLIIVMLSCGAENYFNDWANKFVERTWIPDNSIVTIARSISIVSLTGTMCQVYQCLSTLDKLSAVIMLLWSLLFVIDYITIFEHFRPKLLVSLLIVLLSLASVVRNLTRKQNMIRQTSIKLDDDKYQFNTTNYYDISANGSSKNSDESEMMDIEETMPKKAELHKSVNNLFRGMKLDDNRHRYGVRNNIIRPPKLFIQPKYYSKMATERYTESSPEYYSSSYSLKDDYDEFDTQSIFNQNGFSRQPFQCSPPYHQSVMSCAYYARPFHQPNQLNLSHSSNTSNAHQQTSAEWTKVLIYLIPGIVLLSLQCYLLYDIKDFMKQK